MNARAMSWKKMVTKINKLVKWLTKISKISKSSKIEISVLTIYWQAIFKSYFNRTI